MAHLSGLSIINVKTLGLFIKDFRSPTELQGSEILKPKSDVYK
ncbi:MAG: hypothetical protein AOA65_2186 [Candidatus Bathyarchaeota archaeon BA1]|nr:MAG: hypothetical protein AOA65_2186 [Candidatus Bathyarchaeota archaeon BA1]